MLRFTPNPPPEYGICEIPQGANQGLPLAECGYNEVALGRAITIIFCPARVASAMTAISIGRWIVEASLNRLSCDSRVIQLEPKVMQVLVCLASRPGEVIAKDELISTVWPETFVSEDVLTRSISQLRKVFGDDAREPRYIETISRRGYRLVAPVSDIATTEKHVTPAEHASLSESVSSAARHSPQQRIARRWVLGVAAILGFAAFAACTFIYFRFHPSPPLPLVQATIAVLPFVNLSGNPAEEYFSDGMTEEIVTALSRVGSPYLGVIARTSSMRYKNSGKTVTQIGRELKADYLLEGSVRRSDGKVRVTAQLIRVHDQNHLWAQDYDSELKDILSVQQQISDAVARSTRIKLGEQKVIPVSVDPEAYQLYLKGRYFLDRPRTPAGLHKSLDYFQQAAERDSGFARPWAGVALSYEMLEYVGDMSPRESHPYALAAASRALQLDPDSPEAHLAMAYIHEHYEWNWPARDRELAAAIQLDPNYELARQWLSFGLSRQGDANRALIEMRRAFALDPLSLRVNITLAARLKDAGRPQEAIRLLQEGVDLEPGNSEPHSALADLYQSQGDFEKMADEQLRALQLDNNLDFATQFKALRLEKGAQAAWEQIERQLLYAGLHDLDTHSSHGEYVSPSAYVWTYARLQDRENTLRWMQRAYDEHASILLELRNHHFDFVRDTPQFQTWVRQVAMPK